MTTKWANLPTTCDDFVAHPHKKENGYCYQCQMASASEEQGTTALASALLDLDICCEVVQTGGFTMCVYIKTGDESYIFANDEGFSFYCSEDCEGLLHTEWANPTSTPEAKAEGIKKTLEVNNLEAKEL
jgi:hypothetical protein